MKNSIIRSIGMQNISDSGIWFFGGCSTGWQCAQPNIVKDYEYRPLKVKFFTWGGLICHSCSPVFLVLLLLQIMEKKYPYIETVHPEDTFSIEMGKRKHSKEQPCKGQGCEWTKANATNLKVECNKSHTLKNPKQQQNLMCTRLFCVCAYYISY